eukprot:scaffold244_cov172-Amphora_coffeaeformis.AAC.23
MTVDISPAQKTQRVEPRNFTRDDLELFDLLGRPVWIFDIERKSMWWANAAAVALWNADSLESLLSRDFASDMSESTSKRLNCFLDRFKVGETFSEQWTYYPRGKPVTVKVRTSGIHCDSGRLMMLNEGDTPISEQDIDKTALRRVVMFQHLPLAMVQFDSSGEVMDQNPEAVAVFGVSQCTGPSFVERFVDMREGKSLLATILSSDGFCCMDTKLYTRVGELRWFSIKAGHSKDPITARSVIIYSARDITDVVLAKQEADRINLEKSEFLAVMAHEIRTPLHHVIGFAELLGQTSLTQQQAEYVKFLETSSHGLMTVINDALDYTKLEAGKMKLESIRFEVQDLVAGVASAILPKAESKGLSIKHYACREVPNQVVGDPTRLRQILLNLLHNAVKFTKKGEILLDVKRLEDDHDGRYTLRFEVSDDGIGIKEDHIDQIFCKYGQAEASTARNFGGTGLGLAICKLLVEAMGGKIGVFSEVGEGSTFWFELPYERSSALTESPSLEEFNQIAESSKLHVLIAEDNKVNQKLAAALLKRLGHKSTIANNGLQAIHKLEQNEFDLVLMDVQMPVLDGLAATRRIRETFSRSSLPIIGLTADFRNFELSKYKEMGMNDCIGKPVRLAQLKESIRSAMKKTAVDYFSVDSSERLVSSYGPEDQPERYPLDLQV